MEQFDLSRSFVGNDAAKQQLSNHLIGLHYVVAEILALATQHRERQMKSSHHQSFVGNQTDG